MSYSPRLITRGMRRFPSRQSVWVEFSEVKSGDKWTDTSMPKVTETGKPRSHYDPATFGIMHIGGDNPPVKICRHTEPQKAFNALIEILNNENQFL